MKKNVETIYGLLKDLRIRQDLSQSEVARRLNITSGAYNKIEKGGTPLTLNRLTEIVEVFNLDLFTFLEAVVTGSIDEEKKKLLHQLAVYQSQVKHQDELIEALQRQINSAQSLLELRAEELTRLRKAANSGESFDKVIDEGLDELKLLQEKTMNKIPTKHHSSPIEKAPEKIKELISEMNYEWKQSMKRKLILIPGMQTLIQRGVIEDKELFRMYEMLKFN